MFLPQKIQSSEFAAQGVASHLRAVVRYMEILVSEF